MAGLQVGLKSIEDNLFKLGWKIKVYSRLLLVLGIYLSSTEVAI